MSRNLLNILFHRLQYQIFTNLLFPIRSDKAAWHPGMFVFQMY